MCDQERAHLHATQVCLPWPCKGILQLADLLVLHLAILALTVRSLYMGQVNMGWAAAVKPTNSRVVTVGLLDHRPCTLQTVHSMYSMYHSGVQHPR